MLIIPANTLSAPSGNDNGIFAWGYTSTTGAVTSLSNLISNVGVVATDVTGVGTARKELAACSYGDDKGIFGYGYTGSNVSMTNLVSNVNMNNKITEI